MQLYRRVFADEPLKGRQNLHTNREGPPLVEKAYGLRSLSSPESARMPASYFLPSVEKMSIKKDVTGQSISVLHQYS